MSKLLKKGDTVLFPFNNSDVNTVKDKFILKILGECTPNVMKRIDEGIVLKYKLPI